MINTGRKMTLRALGIAGVRDEQGFRLALALREDGAVFRLLGVGRSRHWAEIPPIPGTERAADLEREAGVTAEAERVREAAKRRG